MALPHYSCYSRQFSWETLDPKKHAVSTFIVAGKSKHVVVACQRLPHVDARTEKATGFPERIAPGTNR
jgi:hypothetical protein